MVNSTPGPWHLDDKGDPRGPNDEPIYLTPATARLFVKAPEMLARLRHVYDAIHEWDLQFDGNGGLAAAGPTLRSAYLQIQSLLAEIDGKAAR